MADPLVIPMKQDPPIMVDGNPEDWRDVKSEVRLGKGQLLANFKGTGEWGGEQDLSGVMRFCWKSNGLYLCAQVTDDVFLQKESGLDCFHGDHLELFMDLQPEQAGGGNDFGEGQFQILVSPGDFGKLKPQVMLAFPKRVELPKAQCASTRQADGWTVEAFIPWQSLNGGAIRENTAIGMHAWISDSDVDFGDHPRQKQILTTGNVNAVFRKRADLAPAIFADAEGKHTVIMGSRQEIVLKFKEPIDPGNSSDLTFEMPRYPQYLSPVLRLHANLTSTRLFSGYTRALGITINGIQLTGKHLIAPRDEFFEKSGKMNNIYHSGLGYLVPYTHDGKAGNRPEIVAKHFTIPYKMHDFAIDLSGIVKEGENKIEVRNNLPTKFTAQLELSDVRISIEHLGNRRRRTEAPKGELSRIVPKAPLEISAVALDFSSSRISLRLPSGRQFVISSRYSTPDGGWAEGGNRFFSHERKAERVAEGFLVKDTFTNLGDENLPIIQLHEITEKNAEYMIGGLPSMASSKLDRVFGNSSVFVKCPDGGLGLYASSLVFREHLCARVTEEGSVVMGDNTLALPPRGSITQEFIAIPLANADYYDFVNAVRRQIGANVTLLGPIGTWAQYKDRMKSFYNHINLLGLHYMLCDYNRGIGVNFLIGPKRNDVKEMMAQIRKERPSIKLYRYFHSQIESNHDVDFKSGRLLLKNGDQAHYGESLLYLNLEGTAYSKMMEYVLDDLLDNWDVDGIYWDEFHYSGKEYHYGEPWDNCSADIDMETHRIETLKSSVYLIQLPWKSRMVDKILAKGKRIYANGCAARMGFEDKIDFTFTETAVKTNNVRMHFTTPLAHENCNGMKSLQDYYLKMMDSLDYGVLGNFSFIDRPGHNVWPTIAEHLYPTTPLELHAGYLIGKERIVTKESGCFGWNDDSTHVVRVFNDIGQEIREHGMKTIKIDGKTFTEIRLSSDWSAVIIRK